MPDLPVGGRKGEESAVRCANCKVFEDFGESIATGRLHDHRAHRLSDGVTGSHFFTVYVTEAEVATVRFGDKGKD